MMLLAACGTTVEASPSSGGGATGEPTVVLVFAAASLTDAFEELGQRFEASNPGYAIELNLAGSSSLRAQIVSGAPADVFASANGDVMEQVEALGTAVDEPRVFATNELAIAVPSGNPAGLGGIEDFARSELFLGLCAEAVPCGDLATQALAAASVEPSVDTREPDVRALLTKIAAGELDGGLVYRTDLIAASDDVDGIEIPVAFATMTDYPIVALDQGEAADGAALFVDFVLSPTGTEILTANGFGQP